MKVRHLSIDPTIRTWMDDAPGYLPPIGIGEVIRSGGIGEVVASRTDALPVGATVFGMLGWQEYALADGSRRSMTVVPPGIDPAVVLGVLGVTGMTAYFGLTDIGQPKPGDTVVVSGAAGATGSVVGQLARINGAGTVVGIAGSVDKCAWLVDELGFDHAINYRTEDVAARIRADLPGRHRHLLRQRRGRDPRRLPGQSGHAGPGGPVRGDLPVQRGPSRGAAQLPPAHRQAGPDGGLPHPGLPGPVPRGPARDGRLGDGGRIHHREHVVEGLDRAGEALNLLFSGGNTGKVVVAV